MSVEAYNRRQFMRRALMWGGAGGLALVVGCGSSDDGEHSDEPPHWTYTGATGPDAWGSLSSDYATCGTGTEQSPIDLAARDVAPDGNVDIHWRASELEAANNGHTLHVGVEPGSSIEIDGERFELVQFHFHAPSEHTVDGAPMAMETHFVHRSEAGELAVIGVLHALGAENAALAPILGALTSTEGEATSVPPMDPTMILPGDRAMYRYAGSLTTPPCSEGVRWHVFHASTTVSEAQVRAYQAIFPTSARPTQPLGSREVLRAN